MKLVLKNCAQIKWTILFTMISNKNYRFKLIEWYRNPTNLKLVSASIFLRKLHVPHKRRGRIFINGDERPDRDFPNTTMMLTKKV